MTILISGPIISKLGARTRKWAHEALTRGDFGSVFRGPKGVLFADVAAVEAFCGIKFTQQQIKRAADGKPGRLLILETEHDDDVEILAEA